MTEVNFDHPNSLNVQWAGIVRYGVIISPLMNYFAYIILPPYAKDIVDNPLPTWIVMENIKGGKLTKTGHGFPNLLSAMVYCRIHAGTNPQ